MAAIHRAARFLRMGTAFGCVCLPAAVYLISISTGSDGLPCAPFEV